MHLEHRASLTSRTSRTSGTSGASSLRTTILKSTIESIEARRVAGLLFLAAALGLSFALAALAAPAADGPPGAPPAVAAGAPGDDRGMREGQLVINEFMASNNGFYLDEFGDDDDWIEILNLGPTAVNLEGKFLTDSLAATQMWEFPDTTIPVGAYLIVWADGEPAEGPLHTTFKLDRAGEQIGLFDYLGVGNGPIDTLSFGLQGTNISFGRYPNGTGTFTYMETPTPTAANQPHLVNLPPFIVDTGHLPSIPSSQDVVTVRSWIADDSALEQTQVFYDAGAGFIALDLHDDGLHNDGRAGDDLWGAQIPPFPDGTHVYYYVRAQDDLGVVSLDPPTAPVETHSYVVRDEAPELYINEFMASNSTTIPDEYGEYDDWVEIYNAGGTPAGLLGLYLTDNLGNPHKFALPDTSIVAGGFMLVWCDDQASQGPLHAPFKLSAPGEQIGIFRGGAGGYTPLDTLSFGPQTTDISRGRYPDGGAEWRFFTDPTPGASNQGISGVEPGAGPVRPLALLARPNPFGAWTALSFGLAQPADLEFDVVDAAGRVVYSEVQRGASAGEHHLVWRGVDAAGAPLPGGMYCCRIQAGSASRATKVLLVR